MSKTMIFADCASYLKSVHAAQWKEAMRHSRFGYRYFSDEELELELESEADEYYEAESVVYYYAGDDSDGACSDYEYEMD